MPYGKGSGMGRGMGMRGGFRGTYAAWPYIGRGKGGLPRCGCLLASQANFTSGYTSNPLFMAGNNLETMQGAAANLKDRLAQMQSRISELEQQKTA